MEKLLYKYDNPSEIAYEPKRMREIVLKCERKASVLAYSKDAIREEERYIRNFEKGYKVRMERRLLPLSEEKNAVLKRLSSCKELRAKEAIYGDMRKVQSKIEGVFDLNQLIREKFGFREIFVEVGIMISAVWERKEVS